MQTAASVEIEKVPGYLTSESVFNVRPAKEKLFSPAAMFKKVDCVAREEACSPQCPVAIWHSKT